MLTKCVYCDGKGKALASVPRNVSSDGLQFQICTVCLGAGQIDIPPNQVICAYCKGRGKDPNAWKSCPVCSGTGKVKPVSYK